MDHVKVSEIREFFDKMNNLQKEYICIGTIGARYGKHIINVCFVIGDKNKPEFDIEISHENKTITIYPSNIDDIISSLDQLNILFIAKKIGTMENIK